MKFYLNCLFFFFICFFVFSFSISNNLQKKKFFYFRNNEILYVFSFYNKYKFKYNYFYIKKNKIKFIVYNNTNFVFLLNKNNLNNSVILNIEDRKGKKIFYFYSTYKLNVNYVKLIKKINKYFLYISLKIKYFKINKSNYIKKNINNRNKFKKILNVKNNKINIAIDPGHGGYDPGAINYRNGIKEKDINLSISIKLLNKLNLNKKIHAFLIRKRDSFVSLKRRFYLINNSNADIVLSIHTDSTLNNKIYGASVWIFNKDNYVNKFNNKFNFLFKSRFKNNFFLNKKNYVSYSIAVELINKLCININLRKNIPQFNNLIVLSSNIPSVLIETGYISNPCEVKKLSSDFYQFKVVQSIYLGIISFINKYKLIS